MNKDQLIAKVLEQVAAGDLKRTAAAETLGISERHLNRLMKARGVKRPPSPTHAAAAEAEIRRQVKQAAALSVYNKEASIEAAALAAGCSERTIYRLLEKMTK